MMTRIQQYLVKLIQCILFGRVISALIIISDPSISSTETGHGMSFYSGSNLVEYYSAVNANAEFTLTAVNGNNAVFTLSYGDGLGASVCNNGSNSVKVNHTYTTVQNYQLLMVVHNSDSFVNTTVLIKIQPELPKDLYLYTSNIIGVIESQTVELTFKRNSAQYPSEMYSETACNITVNGENAAVFERRDLTSNDIEMSTNWTFSEISQYEIKLSCDNYVSVLNVSTIITAYKRISNIQLLASNGTEFIIGLDVKLFSYRLGTDVTLQISNEDGGVGEYFFVIYWGDGNFTSIVCSPNKNISVSQKYPTNGFYLPTLEVSGPVGSQNASLWLGDGLWDTLKSGIKIWDFCVTCLKLSAVNATNGVVIATGDTGYYALQITVENGTSPELVPQKVICSWMVPNKTQIDYPDVMNPVDMLLNTSITKTFELTYDQNNLNHTIEVKCSTPLGDVSMFSAILFGKSVDGITLVPIDGNGYYIPARTQITMKASLTGADFGWSATILLDDNITVVWSCMGVDSGSAKETLINHTYEYSGNYTVKYLATDGYNDINGTLELEAIYPVTGLTLNIVNKTSSLSNVTLIYPNFNTIFEIELTEYPGIYYHPQMVTCMANYGDGSSDEKIVGTMSLPPAGTVLFSHEYTFVPGDSIKNATFNCSNAVSSQILETTVYLFKAVQNISVEPIGSSVYFSTNSLINFYVSIYFGSSNVDLQVRFGDSNQVTTATVLPGNNFTISHTYTQPGIYDVSVIGSDVYDTKLYNLTLEVERPINSTIELDGPSAVIYPSALSGVFEVKVLPTHISKPPSKVTCTYTFPNKIDTSNASSINQWNDEIVNYTFSLSDGEDQIVTVFCWNRIDNYTGQISVHLNRSMENLTLTLAPPNQQTALTSYNTEALYVNCDNSVCFVPKNNIIFLVTSLYGDIPVRYSVDGGIEEKPQAEDFNFTKNMVEIGHITVMVTAYEYTLGESYSAQTNVFVQAGLSVFVSGTYFLGPSAIPVPASYQYMFLVDRAVAYETNATCVWETPNGQEVDSWYDGFSFNASMNFFPEHGKTQTITLNCSNMVSYVVLTHNVTTLRGIANISIALLSQWGPEYCQSGSSCNFNITAEFGEITVNYTVYANSVIIYSTTKPNHIDFIFSHIFQTPGVYNITVVAEDVLDKVTHGPVIIYIQQPLQSIDLNATNTPGTIPDGLVDYMLTHTVTAPVSYQPTNVTCMWTFPGAVLETTDFTFKNGAVFFKSQTLGPTVPIGSHVTNISCANEVSSADTSVVFWMMEKIAELNITANTSIATENQNIAFTITRVGGSGVTYDVNFSDNTQTIPTGDSKVPVNVNHAYAQQNHYNVTVTANNIAEEVFSLLTPTYFIEVQQIIQSIVLMTNNTTPLQDMFQYPNGLVTFIVKPDTIKPIPQVIYLDWDYGDGQTVKDDIPTPISGWSLGYTNQHIYSSNDIGQVTVNVRAHNNVSEVTIPLNITLIEVISGTTATANPTKYAKPSQVISFTITVSQGSHITYSIYYNDTQSDVTQYDTLKVFQPDVLNRRQTFTHSYISPGNYTVTVIASNYFGNDRTTLEITIQNPVPDFALAAMSPVLTPPGLISVNLSRTDGLSYIPSDVVCTWHYTDNSPDKELRYFSTMDLPVFQVQHTYKATSNILSTVDVQVSCSNEVTPVPKTADTTVIITANPVVLHRMRNDGPKMYNESVTWKLEIKSYGEDPCFTWTFNEPTFVVLFGREECKTLKPGYNEFRLVTTPQTELSYSKSYSNGLVVQVDVLAENSISSDIATSKTLVLAEECDLPKVNVGNEGLQHTNPRIEHYSDLISVFGNTVTNCKLPYYFTITWNVYEYNTSTEDIGNKLNQSFPQKAELNFYPRTVPIGLYYIEMVTIMKGLAIDIPNDAHMFLKIVKTPIKAEIVGGTETVVSTVEGPDVMVDGWTLTFDPDKGNTSNKDGILWKWHCQKTSVIILPTINVNWTSLVSYDGGDCNIQNVVSSAPGYLKIPSNQLLVGQMYAMTMYAIISDGRSATFTQIIKPQGKLIVSISITCTENCRSFVNSQAQFRLLGECVDCQPTDTISYTWNIEALNSVTSSFEAVTFNNLEVLQDEQDFLVTIPRNTLSEKKRYKFTLFGNTSSQAAGMAVHQMLVNAAPYDGSCYVDIPNGETLKSKYKVTCNGWHDTEEEGIVYTRRKKRTTTVSNAPNLEYKIELNATYINGGTSNILSYGRNAESPGFVLPVGDSNSNFTVPLFVRVYDTYYTYAFVRLTTRSVAPSNMSSAGVLQNLIDLKRFADAGEIQNTIQLMTTLISMQNVGSFPKSIHANETIINDTLYQGSHEKPAAGELSLVSFFLAQLGKLLPQSPSEMLQINEIMVLLLKNNIDDIKVNPDVIEGLKVLNSTANNLKKVSDEMTAHDIIKLATDSLYSIGVLFKITSNFGIERLKAECNATNCHTNVEQELKSTIKSQVAAVNSIIDIFSEAILKNTIPGGDPVVIETPEVAFVAEKINRNALAGKKFTSKFGFIQQPTNHSLYSNIKSECIEETYFAFKTNPYVWHVGALPLNAPSQQLKLIDCDTRERQQPMNTTYEDPYIGEARMIDPAEFVNETDVIITDTKTQLAYHTFTMKDPDSYAQLYFDIKEYKDVTLTLFISYDSNPNVNSYDFKTVLPRGMPLVMPTEISRRIEYLVNSTNNFTDGTYTYVVPKTVTTKLGKYVVGVLATVYNNAGVEVTEANYTFYVKFVTCRLWFEALDEWQDTDCEVTNETITVTVRFVSKVFPSSFGAGLLIGPNLIDFGTVFQDGLKKLLENIHVLATIIIFILAYFTMLPFALKKDRVDTMNWIPLPLVGFVPTHKYQYQVDIYTGFQSKAGTDSNVYFILVGEKGETEPSMIYGDKRKNFQRGSMNRFCVSSKHSLGKLRFLFIGHDNSGKGDKMDWYLEKVMVTEQQTYKKYMFVCDKWLSLEKGNAEIEAKLKLISQHQLLELKGLVKSRAKKQILEDNLWVSTFFRRDEDHFTRAQRLTVAIALVFLTMISNAMWYQSGDSTEVQDGIQIGPLSFTVQTLAVSVYSVLTILPVTLLILLFFTKSKPRKPKDHYKDMYSPPMSGKNQFTKKTEDSSVLTDADFNSNNNNNNNSNENNVENNTKKKSAGGIRSKFNGRFLPFWFMYIGWFLCFAAVVVSTFFTILYSFQWGGKESAQWLTAFCLSFFESEGLISPLKAVLLALLISILCKKPVDNIDDFGDEYDDFAFSEDENDKLAAEYIEKIQYRRWLQNEIQKAIRVFIWHALFLICLTLVVVGNRNPSSYRCNNDLKNLFFSDLLEVQSQADYWDYVKDTALPHTYWIHSLNGVPVNKLEKFFIVNGYSRRLGTPVMRQFRLKPNHCVRNYPYLHKLRCNLDYSTGDEDKSDYLAGWKFPNVNSTIPTGRIGLPAAFKYNHANPTNYYYVGYYDTYYGRGYSIPMGEKLEDATKLIDELIGTRWLDQYTRAVVIEFNVYNANINLFSLVSVMIEFPSFGATLVRQEIQSVTLYRYIGSWGLFALVSELIIVIFIIVLIIRFIINFVKGKKSFILQVENILELIKIICGFLAIAMYVLRTVMIQQTITFMMNNQDEYANFRGVVLVNLVFVFAIGFALFIQILQVMWVFKFNKSLSQLGGTIRFSMHDLSSFVVVVFCIFMAFAVLYYMYYGTELWAYRDFLHTIYTQMTSMLGKFRINEYEEVGGMFGRIMFVCYTSTMIFIYINLLVVIIVDVYEDVQEGNYETSEAYKAVDLLSEKLKS